jgi:cobalamin biosynthesis Mg chelatase CobN
VLALLAFACLPALAQAECTDSSCKQYEVEIPTSGGKEHKPKHQSEAQNEAPAEASHAPQGKHQKPPSSEGNSEESEESKTGATPGNNGGGHNDGGGQQANPPGGGGQGSEGISGEKQVGGGTTQGQPASHSSGGSSPLVPILIAIAVLAAISIGALIYRQRRQDSGGSGSPVSPKAG